MNMTFWNILKVASALLGATFVRSCKSQNSRHEYVVAFEAKFHDQETNLLKPQPLYWPDKKIWYRDSLIVEEITGLYIDRDSNGVENRSVSIHHYTFIDLPSKRFFDYSSFSDTAKLLKKYVQADSVPVMGGWNFYYTQRVPRNLPVVPLTDTTIDNAKFKRCLLINEGIDEASSQKYIALFSRDSKNFLFSFDTELSKQIGFPLTRLDLLAADGTVFLSTRISIQTRKFTDEENRVFEVWEKLSKNPQ